MDDVPWNETLCLESDELRCHLDIDGQLQIMLEDRRNGQPLLHVLSPLCRVEIDGVVQEAELAEPHEPGAWRLRWSGLPPDAAIELKVRLTGPSLHLRLEATGLEGQGQVCFPFLARLQIGDDHQLPDQVLDADTFRDAKGRAIFRRVDWPLPVVRIGPDERTLTLLIASDGLPADIGLAHIGSSPGLALGSESETRTVFEAELTLHTGGWPAAFDLLRTRIRERFDLTQYERPDLQWYRDQLVQHFTFLYGREILDLESGQFDLERFLDEGARDFGGYDGMLIWGVYPRIGVDERTQWDFYDDLPGGRSGLQAMARRARERGVRFFVPYKPWDQAAALAGGEVEPDHVSLARLVADIEADGVFLDTMSAVAGEMRAALDTARPGVVFCSEGRAKRAAFEVITGSWDQTRLKNVEQGNWSAGEESMPGVDLGRFIFPEHRLFVTNRHATGEGRIRLIQRGFFSGMGWVVWQDIFGLALAYAPEEAALLKKCRTIFREHRQALWAARPTPLIATERAGIYANAFPGVGAMSSGLPAKRLWTFYNETDLPVDAVVLRIEPQPGFHYVDVWNDRAINVGEEGHVRLRLEPHGLGAVVELPCLLQYAPAQDTVRVVEAIDGATVDLRWIGATVSPPPQNTGREVVARMGGAGPCVARLLRDGEVLDQIVIQPDGGRHV